MRIAFLFIFICLFIAQPLFASAHQPRVVEGERINVIDPEISKAYFGY